MITKKKVNLSTWDFLPLMQPNTELSLEQLADIHVKFINTCMASNAADSVGMKVLVTPEAFQLIINSFCECWTRLLRQYVDKLAPGLHLEVEVDDSADNTFVEFTVPKNKEEAMQMREEAGLPPVATPTDDPTPPKGELN